MNKCLLIATCVASALFSGCNYVTTEEVIKKQIFIYNNKLDVPISITYYFTFNNEIKTKNVNINVGGFIEESYDIRYGEEWMDLQGSDSACITFDARKELWYYVNREQDKTGNVFMMKNYKEIEETKTSVTYEYDFNQSIYDLATDIIE